MSFVANTYEICNTSNPNHLNGFITIIDYGDNTGKAIVSVKEERTIKNDEDKDQKYIVEHSSIEDIYCQRGVWQTKSPHHERYNKKRQIWSFNTIDRRTGYAIDNYRDYKNYILYTFTPVGVFPQGNGTGSGGNNN